MACIDTERQTSEGQRSVVCAVVVRHPGGFGFLKAPGHPDVFVPPGFMKHFLGGDEVTYAQPDPSLGKKLRTEQTLKSCRLVRRSAQLQMGIIKKRGSGFFLEADEAGVPDIEVLLPAGTRVPPRENTVVAVSATMPSGNGMRQPLRGNLVAVLGQRDAPETIERYALLKWGFADAPASQEAPPPVWSDARRVCLDTLTFYAIDDSSTQDVDDAISFRKEGDRLILRVAVSDVAAWIQSGTPLDQWARNAGTSLYLPRKTIHMLPTRLATETLSLAGNTRKRVVVLESEYCAMTGAPKGQKVYRAWISAPLSLSYGEALLRCVTEMEHWRLVATFAAQSQSHPGMKKALSGGTHRGMTVTATVDALSAREFVEFCMLEANYCAASLMAEQSAGLFRGQPMPSSERWGAFWRWAERLQVDQCRFFQEGVKALPWPSGSPETRLFLLKLGMRFGGAVYTTKASAHYLLERPRYTHATSPIRRYADLVVQRLLVGDAPSSEPLEQLVVHLNARFRASAEAERFAVSAQRMHAFKESNPPAENTAHDAVWATGLEQENNTGLFEVLLPDFGVAGLIDTEVLKTRCTMAGPALVTGRVRVSAWRNSAGGMIPFLQFNEEPGCNIDSQ